MRIVLLAALSQEIQPLLRRLRPWKKVGGTPFKTYRHTASDREVILIQTGMGKDAICRALACLLSGSLQLRSSRDLLLSIGFAGGLRGDLSAGEVCMVDGFSDHGTACRNPLRVELPSSAERLCGIGLSSVACLTVQNATNKPALALSLNEYCALVDMESYHAASFAHDHGLGFLCIRAVSDGLHDELGFDLSAISDLRGRISLIGVARVLLQNPLVFRSFLKCRQRSNLAAGRLANAVASVLMLPLAELEKLARQARVVPDGI